MTDSRIEDARNELGAALHYGKIADDFTFERVMKAHAILRDWCNEGNLSPMYLMRQDQERRNGSAGA